VYKQAFLMTQLLQKYLDYLPAHIPNTYPVAKLQDRLKIHYSDSMSRLKIRMAACNIWSSLQESATVDISFDFRRF
jgi:hypothetical protein